jgi:hypothetical protein
MEYSEQFKGYIRAINKIKTTNVVKPKKLSGYNLYCQEMRTALTGTSIEIMKQLGEKWKGTSDEIKLKYKEKADKLNEVAITEAKSVLVEDDALVGELKSVIADAIKKFKKDLKKRTKNATETTVAPTETETAPVETAPVETAPVEAVVEKAPKKRVVKKKVEKQ